MIFKSLFLLASILSSGSCASIPDAKEQVKVTLFFEGLCPGCHEFILDSLYPAYQKLGDNLLIDLVPLGNAGHSEQDGEIIWKCQHGELECVINNINACVINLNSTQSQLVEFINCHISKSTGDYPRTRQLRIAEECAEDNNLSWDDINSCVSSEDKVNQLMLAYENRQNSLIPELTYVPHILLNDIFDGSTEDAAYDDIFSVACKLFKEKPAACNS